MKLTLDTVQLLRLNSKQNRRMALLLYHLLLLGAILSTCTCMPISSDVDEVHRIHKQDENRKGAVIYPETFMLATGPYGSSGKYVASSQYFNSYPVYTGPNGSTYWKIYYRSGGFAAGHWVLNGNVHENAHGTVAKFDNLFAPKI